MQLPPDDLSLASPRDLVVNLIVRALDTGAKTPGTANWTEARSQAFGEAAAMAMHMIFGCDMVEAKHVIQLRVRDLRAGDGDRTDTGWVGQQATEILEDVLAADSRRR